MPKETISNGAFNVQVGWPSDDRRFKDDAKFVDIGVILNNNKTDSLIKYMLNGKAEVLGKVLKCLPSLVSHDNSNEEWGIVIINALASITKDTMYTNKVFGSLDRHECNALIKTVRKARDKTFCLDESDTEPAPSTTPLTRREYKSVIASLQSECDRLYGKDQ